jgi:hypothetical protein
MAGQENWFYWIKDNPESYQKWKAQVDSEERRQNPTPHRSVTEKAQDKRPNNFGSNLSDTITMIFIILVWVCLIYYLMK